MSSQLPFEISSDPPVDRLRDVISFILDFFIDAFAHAPDDASATVSLEQTYIDNWKASTLVGDPEEHRTPIIDPHTPSFSVCLWNDESHSFNQVIDIVMSATGCSRTAAGDAANMVDRVGRDVILTTTDLKQCIRAAQTIQTIDLGVTIRSTRDLSREHAAETMIEWVMSLLKHERYGSGGDKTTQSIRRIICEEFMKPWNKGLKYTQLYQEPEGGELTTQKEIAKEQGNTAVDIVSLLSRRLLRIDYFLLNDLKYWKRLRELLKELYVATFIVDVDFKLPLAIVFAKNYRTLAMNMLNLDRESEHNILYFSVQLFTVPSIATFLHEYFDFTSIIIDILIEYFTSEQEDDFYCIDVAQPPFPERRFIHLLSDLKYFLNAPSVRRSVSTSVLDSFIEFFKLFQGMNPNKRYVTQHVEYEDPAWANAFELSITLSHLIRNLTDCFELSSTSDYLVAVKRILYDIGRHIYRDIIPQPETRELERRYKSVLFRVAKEETSFHHPLHWLLGNMLNTKRNLSTVWKNSEEFKSDLMDLDMVADEVRNVVNDTADATEVFLRIFDYPLRVNVFLAQIRAGLWVRNGYSIRAQALHYETEPVMRDYSYDVEFYLLQVALVCLGPDHFSHVIIDRFGILSWFLGDCSPHPDYDVPRTIFMAEECLSLIITLASERGGIIERPLFERIKYEICQWLALSPMKYSQLVKKLPQHYSESAYFEDALSAVASSNRTDAANNPGLYELKTEYYQFVNPFFVHYTRNERIELEDVLKKRADNDKHSPSEFPHHIRPPKITPIPEGPFTALPELLRCPSLVKFLFYSISNVIEHESLKSDTLLDYALYLVILALDQAKADAETAAITSTGFLHHLISLKISYPCKSHQTSFLDVLIELYQNQRFKNFKPRISYLLKRIQESNYPPLKELLDKLVELTESPKDSSADDEEFERKKREAKARQAKILADMANNQALFLQQNADLFDDYDEDEDDIMQDETFEEADSEDTLQTETIWSFPTGNCTICQELCSGNSDKQYGVLGYAQMSATLRKSEHYDKEHIMAILNAQLALDIDNSMKSCYTFNDDDWGGSITSKCRSEKGIFVTTCQHLMHYDCLKAYFETLATRMPFPPARNLAEDTLRFEIMCPLCKSLRNVLIPIVRNKTMEKVQMPEEVTENDINQWFASTLPAALSKWNDCASAIRNLTALPESIDIVTAFRQHLFHSGESGTSITLEDFDDMIERFISTLQMPLGSAVPISHMDSNSVYELWNLLDYTISMIEVSSRGEIVSATSPTYSGVFLTKIPEQVQTFLRVLTLFIHSYTVDSAARYVDTYSELHLKILKYFSLIREDIAEVQNESDGLSLIDVDPFKLLLELAMFGGEMSSSWENGVSVNFEHLMSWMYIMEILRSLLSLLSSLAKGSWAAILNQISLNATSDSTEANATMEILAFVCEYLPISRFEYDILKTAAQVLTPSIVNQWIRQTTLPFLRRLSILLYARFGRIHFSMSPRSNQFLQNSGQSSDFSPEEHDEHSCLLQYLSLPSFSKILSIILANPVFKQYLSSMLNSSRAGGGGRLSNIMKPLPLSLPYDLIRLPKRLDQMFDASIKFVCDNCNTTPKYCAICLICGRFCCFQSFCCTTNERGECYRHKEECSCEIGIFFVIRKGTILFFHNRNGTFADAPYLDQHGESDFGLRIVCSVL
ncbi:hypothetical protein BKA69DRAFT_588597 [Paraphysoderma sedebokerense]|nr:hypothetical protein BKA69DRAFT_588597 [Paraphysoderma sedebokerense]